MSKLNDVVKNIAYVNKEYISKANERLDDLTKPRGSLGRLEEFAARVVAITQNLNPKVDKKVIFTFAGDHGVAEEGVSAFPKEVTVHMVHNFLTGGAGINVLAKHVGADVVIVDIGVDHDFGDIEGLTVKKVVKGTQNICKGPAMTREEALETLEKGIELAHNYYEKGYNIFGTGDMGIANTTPSSAMIAAFSGKSVEDVTGRGTGIDETAYNKKVNTITNALNINSPDSSDPVDVLAKVGGAEIGGIAGLILGAAALKVPVVIDGFISTAGALTAVEIEPKVKDYIFAAHNSVEKGHKVMLDRIGAKPFLDLSLRLGEGTGAALGIGLIDASIKIYSEMATFSEANVATETA